MSQNVSPTQVGIQPSYSQQHTPIHATTSAHLANSSFTDSAQSFSSGTDKADDSPSADVPASSSKGKNGATGPADGKTKPHVCQICHRGFTTGGHLQRHQRIHTGVKAFKCPYPGCETRTSRQDNLQQHYRTHLSPTLRRGSGSAARQAVADAMEAAGLKSTSARGPRKSKGSNGTPGSASSASHLPSPYHTPNGQVSPYAQYGMYDPQQYGGYPQHPLPPPNLMQPQSANCSRVPSPVNGHSSAHSSVGSMPGAHHQQYYSQPYPPAYQFTGGMHQPQFRYGPTGGMPSPYGAPSHHPHMYSPSMAPEHAQQMYSPIQPGFPAHSRESSYGVITPGYGGPMNGYPPPRTQTTTPLSQSHEDLRMVAEDPRGYSRRPPSPHRRSPPDMIAQGVVDPSHMSSHRQAMPMHPAYGGYSQHHMQQYVYGPPQQSMGHPVREEDQRGSIGSGSDDGSGVGSDGSDVKRE